MGPTSDRFAGGDQKYLKHDQYGSTDKLRARMAIHRFGDAATPWFPWLVTHADFASAERIVEVGCGAGGLWERAAPHTNAHVVLSDLSAAMVNETTGIAAAYRPSGVVADVMTLPYASDSADIVIANHMLYHAPDPAQACREIGRVLRPDGKALIATNGAQHIFELKAIEQAVFGVPVLDETVLVFGFESGSEHLEAAFGQVALVPFDETLDVPEQQLVVEYLRSMPPGEDADDEQLAHIRQLVAAAFAERGSMTIQKDVGLFVCEFPVSSQLAIP